MNFSDYENGAYQRYLAFAEIVKHILEKAISDSALNPPQSIQFRAKTPSSLRNRLEEHDLLLSDAIEKERRDLAGARVIFYTNTDVERFRNSSILHDNFEIDRDAIKIHHPLKENEQGQYRAIHYTVCLKANRSSLIEYKQFHGMRCEIQVHTILNHAWSETSHDIAYKSKLKEGFGTRAADAIRKRLDGIMNKYLLPAGYEFQRVQHDFERLKQGKELFDQNIIAALSGAVDNNERHELLENLKDHVLPNYDDVPAIFEEIVELLHSNAKSSISTPIKNIETAYGNIKGKTPQDIFRVIIEIIVRFRYAKIEATFTALCWLFQLDTGNLVRKELLQAVEALAKYDLEVWKLVGPNIQDRLADLAELIPQAEQKELRPLLMGIWGALLAPEIVGTEWKGDTVTLMNAPIPITPQVAKIRERSMSALFALFSSAAGEGDKRNTWLTLRKATQTSGVNSISNDLLQSTYVSNITIISFLEEQANSLSFELLQAIEHQALYDYHRARSIANNESDNFGCRTVAADLTEAIIRFRDRINGDENFVRYKTLVGYESVFPIQWEDEDRDYQAIENYRSEEIQKYVRSIDIDNSEEWREIAERCASTKSDDLATFPKFGEFLQTVGQNKPTIVGNWLERASEDLLRFLPSILDGLLRAGPSGNSICHRKVDELIKAGSCLSAIVRFWRFSKLSSFQNAELLLKKAISNNNEAAVSECVLLVLEADPAKRVPASDKFLTDALGFLTSRKSTWWINQAWAAHKPLPFFESLTESEASALLDNLIDLPKLTYLAESLLGQIADKYLDLVWDFFGRRLRRWRSDDDEFPYEAVPYQLTYLRKAMSTDVAVAVSKARAWFVDDADRYLFRFRGARLLSTIFPLFPIEFSAVLCEMVLTGSDEDTDFVIAVMENYHGEIQTHEVLKNVVAKYPNDEAKITGVAISLESSGVVMGEYGFAEALQEKQAAIREWLTDPRLEVREFADRQLRSLDIRIAHEYRRSDEDRGFRQVPDNPE